MCVKDCAFVISIKHNFTGNIAGEINVIVELLNICPFHIRIQSEKLAFTSLTQIQYKLFSKVNMYANIVNMEWLDVYPPGHRRGDDYPPNPRQKVHINYGPIKENGHFVIFKWFITFFFSTKMVLTLKRPNECAVVQETGIFMNFNIN